MKTLRNLIFIFAMTLFFSLSVSAQKNDQDKKPPPKDPPVVTPKEKPPQRPPDNGNNDNRPKKPQMAFIRTSDEINVLSV